MELDTASITTIIVAVVAIAVAVFAAVRSGQTVTVEAAMDTLSDIEIAAGAAKQWVLAAEQLWLTGKLEKDARFEYVLDKLQGIYPAIDEETLAGSIEAAVAWAKMFSGTAVQAELTDAVGWHGFPEVSDGE